MYQKKNTCAFIRGVGGEDVMNMQNREFANGGNILCDITVVHASFCTFFYTQKAFQTENEF